MAEIQFSFNTNVKINSSIKTNFFSVSVQELVYTGSISSLNQEICSSIINEKITIYNNLINYCNENLEQSDILAFNSNLERSLSGISPKYIQKISYTISDIVSSNVSFNRSYSF